MLSRYGDINFIMEMDLASGYSLITEAFVQDEKEKLFQIYLQIFTKMSKEEFLTFEEYYESVSIMKDLKEDKASRKNSKLPLKEQKAETMNKIEDILTNYSVKI